ncbi:MAG: hypothetical protein FVQ81_07685 [Candidatus Glassbacteria bacterium]|nr:hypothetical protein [Candidatus Glassbacteria bacterium]
MQCPIDDGILIDFLEGELEGAAGREVEQHTGSCIECGRRLERLRAVRTAIRDKVAGFGPPDEQFWRRNLEAVGLATWQSREPGSGKSGGRLRKLLPLVAAAAVLLLALVGTFRTGLFDNSGARQMAAVRSADTISTQALVDSLYLLAEIAHQYQMTYRTLESIEELGSDSGGDAYDEVGITYPVTGNFYDALLDLEEDKLEQVIYLLASN